MDGVVVAADLGGTHLRAALVDESGAVSSRRERPTPQSATTPEILATIASLIEEVAGHSQERPLAACLGTPGLIDAEGGVVIIAPNIPGFRNLALTPLLAQRTGLQVFI